MDDIDDDARYSPKNYSMNEYSTRKSKLPARTTPYSRPINNGYYDDDEDEDEEGAQYDEELDEYDEDHATGDNEDEDEDDQYSYKLSNPKKRKLKNLVDYETSPFDVKISPNDWTEHETFVLLEAWGDRFLQLGRKSLRSEDWVEVAEKVSETSKIEKTDTQCRKRLDVLKKRYKKEKVRLETFGGNSKWGYFKKMDFLMAVSPRQLGGLACGVDSGEYVFMNPNVYLNCANGFDEMRDSPGNSESCEGDEDGDDDEEGSSSSSFRLLADSIQKFGEIHEKIENSKRQQMMELEKMRMDFHRELELQKKQIIERAEAEIEKIRDGDDDDDDSDPSAENLTD